MSDQMSDPAPIDQAPIDQAPAEDETLPPVDPIEFCARDQYHAISYLATLPDTAVKAGLLAALHALAPLGPVRVVVVDDGSFTVQPFSFVQV